MRHRPWSGRCRFLRLFFFSNSCTLVADEDIRQEVSLLIGTKAGGIVGSIVIDIIRIFLIVFGVSLASLGFTPSALAAGGEVEASAFWEGTGLPAGTTAANSLPAAPAAYTAEPDGLLAAAGDVPDAAAYDPHKQAGHAHGGTEDGEKLTAGQLLFYAVRFLYYAALLYAAGVMMWHSGVNPGNALQRGRLEKCGLLAARALLLAVLLHVFTEADRLMEGQQGGGTEWLRLFTETNVGRSWIALVALALLGFAALKLPDPAKAVWALLLLAAESWNGHPLASPNATASVLLDFAHLISAALWAGGLLVMLAFWREDRKEAARFAETFSRTATVAMAALIATGAGTAATLLPGWSSLLYTSWGRLLVAKTALAAAVVVVGILLRLRAKRRKLPSKPLLAADVTLLAAITVIAGLFTYMTPVPAGEPLAYHQMGDTRHITVNLSPNAVGHNTFTVKVWLPETAGEPRQVRLVLHASGRAGKAPIEVPLAPYEDTSYESFEGFNRYSYRAEKFVLADPDDYEAELTIVDGSGRQTDERIPFRNY